ncbi:hypothetical protein [Chthonobacter rhizosphaerae]|uniref:hypothetical protein n=1 Tax=Chthonobacter rhizosphaerae TaxID=2735553 RepID=UPI0015EFA21D|nr:hypothetical protein [Chthonobacter rhizosphaerae]
MRGLDDPVMADGQKTTLRALHESGKLALGSMNHLDADDWQAGGDLFYVEHTDTKEMWPVSRETWTALGGA